MTPTAIQVPEEIQVQSIAKVTAQTDIQILDDLDLDDNDLMNATSLQTKRMSSDTVDTFESASISNTDIRFMARINLDGNDLYNVDDFEVDNIASQEGNIGILETISMVDNDILRVGEIQAQTFTDL